MTSQHPNTASHNVESTKLQSSIEKLKQTYQHQPEFIQAVTEIIEDIASVYAGTERYDVYNVIERITEPDRIISFRVNWEDDNGNVQVNRGWRVQFCNALGPYKGGIRFHPSVNQSVLKFLGFEQIFKNALTGLPLGGGKGGSDFNPKGKSEAEIRRFCYAFMRELRPYIGSREDVPAGDINVGGREIGYLFAMHKSLSHQFTGVLTGKGLTFGGSQMRTEATGYGVVYFLKEVAKYHGDNLTGKTVAISGAGNVATFAAQKCMQLGMKVVTLSNSKGSVYIKAGMTEDMLEWHINNAAKREPIQVFADTFDGVEYFEKQKPWHVKADVALPCATQNEVDLGDVKNMLTNGVKYVIEGANMPLSIEAINFVQAHDSMIYAPGKAANAGGVAMSGLEMSQNAVGQYDTPEHLESQLEHIMINIHNDCVEHGTLSVNNGIPQVDYKKGANIAGFKKVADALCDYGIL